MHTDPISLDLCTYTRPIVERAEFAGISDTSHDPLRKELAMGGQLHVGMRRVWMDDSEVVGTVVRDRDRGAFAHDADAILRVAGTAGR